MGRGRSSSSSRGRSSSSSRGGSSSRSISSSSSSSNYSGSRNFRYIRSGSFSGTSNNSDTTYCGNDSCIGYNNFGYVKNSSSDNLRLIIITALIILAFAIIFLFVGINGFVTASKYGQTTGVCTENTYINDWYHTTYNYNIDGIDYQNISKEGWELPEVIGKSVEIYYLKADPNIITELQPTNNTENIILFIVGCVLVAVTVLMIVSAFKTKKTEKLLLSTEYINCDYCGTKIKKNTTSCPNCGSAIK